MDKRSPDSISMGVPYTHMTHPGHAVGLPAQQYSQHHNSPHQRANQYGDQHQPLPSEIQIHDHSPAGETSQQDLPTPDTQPQAHLHARHVQGQQALHPQPHLASMSMEEQQRHLASLAHANMHAAHGHGLTAALQAPLTGDIHLPQLLPSNSTDAAEQPLYHLEHPEQDGLEDLNDRKRAAFKASKHPGVSWHRQKQQWRAQLKHGKQTHTVGYYETEEEAAQAHDQAKAEAKASGAPPIDEARASSTDKGPVGASYSKVKNKWRAQIMRNNRNRHLGYFETKEEALAVYEAARKEGIFPESRRQGVLDPRPQPPDGNVLATSEGRIKSAYQGVTWNKQKGKWQTRICSGGKRRNLGYFASDKEAHEAYMKAKEADNEIRRQQQQQGQAGGTAEGLPLPELPNQDPDVVRDVNTMLVDEPPTQPLYNNMSAPGAAHYTDPSDHPSLPAQAAHYGSGDVPLPTATQHYSAADSEPAAGHYNDDQQQQQQQQLSSRGMQYTAANGTPPPMSRGQYGAVSSSHQSLPGREDASTHQLEESYLNPAVYADAHNAYQGGVAYAGQQAAQPAYSSHQQDDHQADVQHPYAQLSTSHMSGRLADGQTQMEHEHMPST